MIDFVKRRDLEQRYVVYYEKKMDEVWKIANSFIETNENSLEYVSKYTLITDLGP